MTANELWARLYAIQSTWSTRLIACGHCWKHVPNLLPRPTYLIEPLVSCNCVRSWLQIKSVLCCTFKRVLRNLPTSRSQSAQRWTLGIVNISLYQVTSMLIPSGIQMDHAWLNRSHLLTLSGKVWTKCGVVNLPTQRLLQFSNNQTRRTCSITLFKRDIVLMQEATRVHTLGSWSWFSLHLLRSF